MIEDLEREGLGANAFLCLFYGCVRLRQNRKKNRSSTVW